jgi:TonB-dependent SusC/RagA subfamily outer membrane receptor
MKKTLIFAAALLLSCGVLGAQEKVRPANEKTQYNTVFDLLRAEPGVQVSPGGDNGQMPRIIIRGVGTNSDQTQPLFVVDGIITDNVTYLRPEDIYSVEVLKDGTASIYGVQGQNGVIMFRTKQVVEAEKAAAEARKAEKAAARAARRKKK